ncbi:MAG TPA: acylphosphatase [Candidatus Omnitrophota bacterium]|nr:acylphosphatase [Candidatus Omnitrophota bacterium]
MASVKRAHIYYSGSVQGVGFRFSAERFALSFGISGWAKNLADGRVEVLCEGQDEEIDRFLQEINRVFKEHIEDTEIEWDEPTGEFDTFEIRF